MYALNDSFRLGLQLSLTGFMFVILSFSPYFMKPIFNPAKGLFPGFLRILILSFLMMASLQGMAQSEFGYRWVKKIQENQFYLNEILSLKKLDNSLFSAGPTNIHQFNSEGAIVRSIPVPNRFMAGYSDYTELEFYRIRSGNFFLHMNYGYIPFCGLSVFGNGTAEGFIKPDTGRLLSHFIHQYDDFFGGVEMISGTRSFSLLTSNEKIFTHHPSPQYFDFPNNSLSHRFQLSDTAGNPFWKKTILSQEGLQPKFSVTDNSRILIAFHTSDTIVSDSATQHIIPIQSKSFVELYFDSTGALSESRILPDSFNYTNITFKQEYYQPDGSLYQSLNEPNNPGNTTSLRFIDKTGQQKWIRKFHNTGSIRISKDDSSNVLCHRYGGNYWQDGFRLEVLNRNGQTIWADTNGTQQFATYPNVCTNLGVMNWAIQFHTITDLNIGNFHSPNPSLSEYREYLLNIRETEELSVYTTDQYCTSDTAEIALLNLPGVDSLWHDSIQVQLSDSAGNFSSPTILAYSTGASIRIPFPSTLPQGRNYRLRLFAPTLNKYGPESGAFQILSDPAKPVITTSNGAFATCGNKPIQLQVPASVGTSYYWSNGTIGNSTSVSFSKTISVEARIGGCRTNSDTIQIQNVPNQATFQFSDFICGNSNGVSLTTVPATGRWSGPHVDSTGLKFIPSGPTDTVVIHFSDHSNPQCPIDTSRTVTFTALPILQQLGNAGFCQSNRKIALPNRNLPLTQWYSMPNFFEFNDSVSLALPGTFQFICRSGTGNCQTSIQTNITVIPLDQSPCRPTDTAAFGDVVLQNLNCVPAQYFSRIMLDSSAFAQTPPNRFELWLSDSSGNFDQATKLGEGYQPLIEVKFPAHLKESTGYKVQIRIIQDGTQFSSPGQPVQVFRTPPKPTIQILGDNMYCAGNQNFSSKFTSTNTNHYSNLWMPGNLTVDTLIPQVGVSYTLQYVAHGCISPGSQSRQISYSTPPVCNLVNNPNVCTPYSVVLLRTNQGTGLWTGPNVDSLTSKFYPVDADDTIAIRFRKTFTNSTCPVDTIYQFITRHRPTLPPFDTLRLCENMAPVPLPSTAWTTTWAGEHVSNGFFNPAQIPGVYNAVATTTNGFCQATTNLKIQVKDSLDAICVTGIGTVRENDGFRLYPNPNNGSFVLESENILNADKLRLFNALGQQITHVQVQYLSERSLKISGLPTGLFIVEAKDKRWTVAVQ